MKNKLIKWVLSAALLLGAANNAFSAIFYSQKQAQKEVKLEQVLNRIGKKYPKKQVEYFSRGFLQFKEGEFVKDSEIEKMIENLNPDKEKAKTDPNYVVDGVNFHDDFCFMIDDKSHHIGDDEKSWLPIKKPESLVYEKKFIIKNLEGFKNPRLGIELMFGYMDNKVYINENLLGTVPKFSKAQWTKMMEEYKEGMPFLYREFDVSKYSKQGENIIRIESEKSGRIFKNYNDFLFRRIQIVYSMDEKDTEKK